MIFCGVPVYNMPLLLPRDIVISQQDACRIQQTLCMAWFGPQWPVFMFLPHSAMSLNNMPGRVCSAQQQLALLRFLRNPPDLAAGLWQFAQVNNAHTGHCILTAWPLLPECFTVLETADLPDWLASVNRESLLLWAPLPDKGFLVVKRKLNKLWRNPRLFLQDSRLPVLRRLAGLFPL